MSLKINSLTKKCTYYILNDHNFILVYFHYFNKLLRQVTVLRTG